MTRTHTQTLVIVAALAVAGVAGATWLTLHGSSTSNATSLEFSGNIEAHESVLSFKLLQSRIVELPFDEGQWVKRGTLIAKVDDADYRQQVAIAGAAAAVQQRQIETAERNLLAAQKVIESDLAELDYKRLDAARIEGLLSSGFVSTDARDLAVAGLKQAQAVTERDRAAAEAARKSVELAKASLHSAEEALKLSEIQAGYAALTAPFDGVILVRQAELGEVVSPGTPIVTLADIDHVWLRAYVNEPDIGRVRLGQRAIVTTDTFPGKRYEGRVSFIAEKAEFTPKTVETHAERVTLVYRIRVDVANPDRELVPGMPADARIDVATRP
ncbi:MAG TPA: efflux RND transporter periplasmic adaptor subunit [Steroidobacteraceae bacterium]|jgi:HlyD family secretion protein|nr:efflux RND transporter periplasmic adaptor subunit [Steroidobacteraceae bacterium]